MEGFEFIPDGFVCCAIESPCPALMRVINYDDIEWMKVGKEPPPGGGFKLRVKSRTTEDFTYTGQDLAFIVGIHKQILVKFLEYKRSKPKKALALERLAQAHEALAGHAACFMNEIEIVPGIPGREAEAAVDRCNNRKRAREEGKEE